jgi:hypothetical protein
VVRFLAIFAGKQSQTGKMDDDPLELNCTEHHSYAHFREGALQLHLACRLQNL